MQEKLNHSKKPLIGISATLLKIESGCFAGRMRAAVGYDYVLAVKQAGGVPLMLPVLDDEKLIRMQLESMDGLIVSGGYDIDPFYYGETPQPGLEDICPARDSYEIHLVHHACKMRKPILGICRGLQLLNIAFGGSLYQDIPLALPSSNQHRMNENAEFATHPVDLLPGTRLRNIMGMGESKLFTNSIHHQAIKQLAPGFMVNALALDGVIEGIESKDGTWILGVQWHPEFMNSNTSSMLKLFYAFIEASRSQKDE